MQRTERLQEIIRERGKKKLPLERVYRMLFNPELYLIAYAKLYRNDGAMTEGTTGETVDGMLKDKIDRIIELLKQERYRWSPARRVYIPKKNGKQRPLGIPPWSDKLLQEVIRMILSAYYEPKFAENSHGFREGRGCHTALGEIRKTWTGTNWFIEGDIKGCFDNIDQNMLLHILERDIHDKRFLRLLKYMMESGYVEDWKYNKTYSGTPQGGVISPLLANIYMNELDQFINEQVIPKWTRGKQRADSQKYKNLWKRQSRLWQRGNIEESKKVRAEMQRTPAMETQDPGYRRIRYVRYADDFLLGFIGTKKEAEEIKEEIGQFLRNNLKLEMSQEKTLVTHAKTQKARFLNYEIQTAKEDTQRYKPKGKLGRRSINGRIIMGIPEDVMKDKAKRYMRNGKAIHMKAKMDDSDYNIVQTFQSEYRGIVNYYRQAYNLHKLSKLKWIMGQTVTKTLAIKHKTTVKKIYDKYQTEIMVEGRKYKILQVIVKREGKDPMIATWGGIPLKWNPTAPIVDMERGIWIERSELIQRLTAGECEYCGSTKDIEVHHVRRIISPTERIKIVPLWKQVMRARRRKTMIVCHECHTDVTAGRPIRNAPSGKGYMWTGKTSSSSRKINALGEPDEVNSLTSGSVGGNRKSV